MRDSRLHYVLKCTCCGKEYDDVFHDGFLLACPAGHPPALLQAQYTQKTFNIQPELPGLFRFAHWLPVRRILPNAPGPVVFRSKGLAARAGLRNLWIVFSGYWPEKGALMETCTFKELEAPPVCARIPEGEHKRIVVSSAGNTARAFLHICSQHAIPLVVVVPEVGLPWLWMTREKHPCVTVVVLTGDVDYYDAIRLGNIISESPMCFPEGGVKNLGRRDGLGAVLLSAVETIGEMPAHYFQAVGSGTGGIAVWEMMQRLLEDGRFGTKKMRLHLAQNAPFTPMTDAWQQNSRSLLPVAETEQRARLQQTRAHVLSNRQPPYAITGGVYDALQDTDGFMYAVSNKEAERAGALFLQEEGCDLDPAAEVAVASLIQAVEIGRIGKHEQVVVNITGGGYHILQREKQLHPVTPDLTIASDDLQHEQIVDRLQQHFYQSKR